MTSRDPLQVHAEELARLTRELAEARRERDELRDVLVDVIGVMDRLLLDGEPDPLVGTYAMGLSDRARRALDRSQP